MKNVSVRLLAVGSVSLAALLAAVVVTHAPGPSIVLNQSAVGSRVNPLRGKVILASSERAPTGWPRQRSGSPGHVEAQARVAAAPPASVRTPADGKSPAAREAALPVMASLAAEPEFAEAPFTDVLQLDPAETNDEHRISTIGQPIFLSAAASRPAERIIALPAGNPVAAAQPADDTGGSQRRTSLAARQGFPRVAAGAGTTQPLAVGQPDAVGGTLTVNGTYAVAADDAYKFVYVGTAATNVVNHTAGTLTVGTSTAAGEVDLGMTTGKTGTYKLSGSGVLNIFGDLYVGGAAFGAFVQNGATVSVSDGITLGSSDGSACAYTLNAGTVAGTVTTPFLIIGDLSVATFTQNSGTVTVGALGSNPPAGTSNLTRFEFGGKTGDLYQLNGGTLAIPDVYTDTQFPNTGTFNFNGGVLQAIATSATTTFMGGLLAANVQAGGAKIDTNGFNVTINQPLLHNTAATLDGGLTKQTGTGTLTLSGASTYTGPTTVNAGILQAGVASVANTSGAFGNNSAVILAATAGVTLDLNGFNTQIGSLAGGSGANGNVTLGSATLSVGGDNTSTSYAGIISGASGGLTKIGTGTQILTAASTYGGTTTVSGGTLQIDNNPAGSPATAGRLTSTTGITLNNGGTLLLSGAATVTDRLFTVAPVTINGGGKLATGGLNEGAAPTGAGGAGGAVGVGSLTLAATTSILRASVDFGNTQTGSALVFSSLAASGKGSYVSVLNWTGLQFVDNGATTNDRLLFVSDPGFTRTDLLNWQFSNDTGVAIGTGAQEITYNGYFEIVPVPEPATWLGGALMVAAATVAWRRNQAGLRS